ncbi:Sterol regulatory element-binding protein ECM22 [Pseudozyma hubeiensis]|nr:Sterol regulatory element-binding protein ECM22 [Pseudozyma hubeiensis]
MTPRSQASVSDIAESSASVSSPSLQRRSSQHMLEDETESISATREDPDLISANPAATRKRPPPDTSTADSETRTGPYKASKGKAKFIPNRVKRYHERSLAGCLTCRKRRVKCDEAKPVCRRCACGDRDCIYPDLSPASANDLSNDAMIRKAEYTALPGLHVSSLVHDDRSPPLAGSSADLYFSPPAGVGPASSSHRPQVYASRSPQSSLDQSSPQSPISHRNGRARASTSGHNNRYRIHSDSERLLQLHKQASSDYDHHRPHTYTQSPHPRPFASSSIDMSKVKLPELPAGFGFDHLDAYFPTYEQQCLFRHYILEVAPQLCVIQIPLSDNRWIRYHATFAVRHPHGVNGYEDALRSALLSMASLDIGHKLSQSPIPDLFPSIASREDAMPSRSDKLAGQVRGLPGPSSYSSTLQHAEYPHRGGFATNGSSESNSKSIMSNVLLELSNLRREESLRLLRSTLKERRAPLDRNDAAIMLATVLGLATRDRLAAQQDWQDALHIASRAIAELGGPAAFVDQSDPSSLFLIEQIACFDALSSLTSDDYTLFLQPWDDWWYALMDSPRSIKEDSVLQTFGLHRGMIDMLARMTRVEATRRELQQRTSVTIILSEAVGAGSPPALPPEYDETRLWLESTARALVAEIPIWAKMQVPAEATRTLQTLLPVIMNHLYVAAAELYIHSVIFSKPADHPCFAEPTAVVLDRTEEAIQAGITKGLVLPLSFAAFSARHQDRDRIRAMLNELRPYYKFDLERMEKLNEHLWSLVDSGLTPTDWGMFLKSVGCFNWAF